MGRTTNPDLEKVYRMAEKGMALSTAFDKVSATGGAPGTWANALRSWRARVDGAEATPAAAPATGRKRAAETPAPAAAAGKRKKTAAPSSAPPSSSAAAGTATQKERPTENTERTGGAVSKKLRLTSSQIALCFESRDAAHSVRA